MNKLEKILLTVGCLIVGAGCIHQGIKIVQPYEKQKTIKVAPKIDKASHCKKQAEDLSDDYISTYFKIEDAQNEILKDGYSEINAEITTRRLLSDMNRNSENLINILMNHEIEKTFNDIAYNKIIRGANTQGIEDIELLEILKYGHNKETLRLLDSDFYSLIFLKRENKSYIEKRIQKIEELQGELMGVKSCKQKKF
jgi:capsular polysaccharide biosynthesis protein